MHESRQPPYALPKYEAAVAQNRQESVLARSIRDDRKSGASAQRIMREVEDQSIRKRFFWCLFFEEKALAGKAKQKVKMNCILDICGN
jgi:hypothetical protein